MGPVLAIFFSTILVTCGICFWALRRASEVFVVSVERGRARLVRGQLSPRVLSDMEEVVASAQVERATIRGVADQARVRLVAAGTTTEVAQRLRNVFGARPTTGGGSGSCSARRC